MGNLRTDQAKIAESKTRVSSVVAYLSAATLSQLPVSMGPLMLVFLAHERYGTFSQGPLLVGAFVVGELVGSATLGVFGRAGSARLRLSIGLFVSGLAFAGIAAGSAGPSWTLYVLAFIAGLAPAAAPGFMQAGYLNLFSEDQVPRGLILLRTQSTITFMAGPALAGALSFSGSVWSPALAAAFMVGAVALVPFLVTPGTVSTTSSDARERSNPLAILAKAWPIYALGLVATFVVGLVELVLPAHFAYRGYPPGWAGFVAGAFFLAGLAGTAIYGLRKKWPAGYGAQHSVITAIVTCALLVMAWAPSVYLVLAGAIVAGAGVATMLAIRILALRASLPKRLHPAAFSINYSISCVSYLLCAIIASATLIDQDPAVTLVAGAVGIMVVTLVAAVFGRRFARTPSASAESGATP